MIKVFYTEMTSHTVDRTITSKTRIVTLFGVVLSRITEEDDIQTTAEYREQEAKAAQSRFDNSNKDLGYTRS